MGVQPELQIRTLLDAHIEREADRLVNAALEAQASGDAEAAIRLMHEALAQEPENPRLQIPLAELLLRQEQYGEAEATLRGLPADLGAEERVARLFARLEFARLAETAPPLSALEQALASDPADSRSRHQLAARLILAGSYERAMEQLLELMRRDRRYEDDAGRKGLLKLFEMLDSEEELVARYRRLMFNALH
jgi:putative thioredoxin